MIMVKSEMGREGGVFAAANRRSRAPSAQLKKDVCICPTPRTIVGLKEFHYLEKHLASIFSPHAFPNPKLTSRIAKTLALLDHVMRPRGKTMAKPIHLPSPSQSAANRRLKARRAD